MPRCVPSTHCRMRSHKHKRSVSVSVLDDIEVLHEGTSVPTSDWTGMQGAIMRIFQTHRLQDGELSKLQGRVRNLVANKAGSLLHQCYVREMLPRGMAILLEVITTSVEKGAPDERNQLRLKSLAMVWNGFFTLTLPTLQAVFIPFKPRGPSIRQTALLAFRDRIVLNLPMKNAIILNSTSVPGALPALRQLSLVLHGVGQTLPMCDNSLRMEIVASRVVHPFLGSHGVFSSDSSAISPDLSILVNPIDLHNEEEEARDLRQQSIRIQSGRVESWPELLARSAGRHGFKKELSHARKLLTPTHLKKHSMPEL